MTMVSELRRLPLIDMMCINGGTPFCGAEVNVVTTYQHNLYPSITARLPEMFLKINRQTAVVVVGKTLSPKPLSPHRPACAHHLSYLRPLAYPLVYSWLDYVIRLRSER